MNNFLHNCNYAKNALSQHCKYNLLFVFIKKFNLTNHLLLSFHHSTTLLFSSSKQIMKALCLFHYIFTRHIAFIVITLQINTS